MNYLNRSPRREIIVNVDDHTIHIDLVQNTLTINNTQKAIKLERDSTYIAEHQAMLENNFSVLCSLQEASKTLLTIEAAETSGNLKHLD